MNAAYKVREMKKEEYVLLSDFLYEAIFVPEGTEPPPKTIIAHPELQEYIAGFGTRRYDRAFIAEVNGNVVGAIWARIMNDYGHIDENTPSLALAVYKEYRGAGIGTALLKRLLCALKTDGHVRVSLSVQKENYAQNLYKNAGFYIVDESDEEYIMVLDLDAYTPYK